MTTKKFTTRAITRCVIFAILVVAYIILSQSMPTISNEVALTQMQNSNEMFTLMNTYAQIKPIINVVFVGVILWFTGMTTYDTYKFVKTITTTDSANDVDGTNEKEN